MTRHHGQKSKPWTRIQLALLQKLHDEGKPWSIVAQHCNHSADSCSTTYNNLKAREANPLVHSARELRLVWTEAGTAELVRLREVEKLPWQKIDALLGRSFGGSRSKYEAMHGRRKQGSTITGHPSGLQLERFEPTPAALAERAARKRLEHTDLTAALCGDPLPGRSALDKRGVVG